MTDTAIVAIETTPISVMPAAQETAQAAVNRAMATYKAINTLVDATFLPGVDFADRVSRKKPGEEGYKPTLELPGMEKVMGLLGLTEQYRDIHVIRDISTENPFFYFEVECILHSITTGQEVARGQGVCHSREQKYMRVESRTCPKCDSAAIMKSKYPPRDKPNAQPGWYCNPKQGGCGANFDKNDPQIAGQEVGNVADAQLVWDSINAIRKMANKRAMAAAVKRVGMLSSRFTVDLEDDLRFGETELNPPVVVQQKPESPPTTPEPSPQTRTEPKHWSETLDGRKLIVEMVKRATTQGWITPEQGESDLLHLIQQKSWHPYPAVKEAGQAVKDAVEALKTPPTPQKPDSTQYAPVERVCTVNRFRYDGQAFHFQTPEGDARFYSRQRFAELLNDEAFVRRHGLLTLEASPELKPIGALKVRYALASNGNYLVVKDAEILPPDDVDAFLNGGEVPSMGDPALDYAPPEENLEDIPF